MRGGGRRRRRSRWNCLELSMTCAADRQNNWGLTMATWWTTRRTTLAVFVTGEGEERSVVGARRGVW